MPRNSISESGWRGAVLVAITYVDFLIFAQFAFLKRLSDLGVAAGHLKAVMAAMAVGGILFSLLIPRLRSWSLPSLRLRVGLAASAAAAFLSLLPLGFAAAVAVAFLIGAGLGILTITLVTHLRNWVGTRNPLLMVGIGTGIGYLACNFPPLFNATPRTQALVASLLCLFGLAIPLSAPQTSEGFWHNSAPCESSFFRVLAAFTALVWLDSAAFFIIQSNPGLKAGTWQGSAHLWANGVLHCAGALGSAWLLSRKGILPVLAAAFVALGSACLLLVVPGQILIASLLYPIGVSLYSVALVAFPSLLARGSIDKRGQHAGWLYAIAGWIGSAMGIGMAQNLGRVPPLFVAAAGAAILVPQFIAALRQRTREVALVGVVALAALSIDWSIHTVNASHQSPAPSLQASVERGRQVYISEGCIHCHSQYVRPNSPDVLMWGPVEPIEQIRREQPPLIGNRRQGPDLSQVGARRSALWLKAHLYAPAQVSGASVMPSYAFLFHDERGDELVAYLASLQSFDAKQRDIQEEAWRPSEAAWSEASTGEGKQLYNRYCATCHDSAGGTHGAWQASFHHAPTDFKKGSYRTLKVTEPREQQLLKIARIVKFGISGTDMPGHEYLPDQEVGSISLWLSQKIEQSSSLSENTPLISGEKP